MKASGQFHQYIPARKFFTSLILLGCDEPNEKADQIFHLYDHQRLGYLTVPQFKELIDHLYFLVLYALPATIDKHDYSTDASLLYNAQEGIMSMHKQIQYLKQEMLKNAQADKHNLVRRFTGGSFNHKIITRTDFRKVFKQEQSLHNALGLRSRLMPVIASSSSAIYIKQEMLRRCYAPKAAVDRKKRVRFIIKTYPKPTTSMFQDDDRLSVKSSRSEKVTSKGFQQYNTLKPQQYQSGFSARTHSNKSNSRQLNTSAEYSERQDSQLHLTTSHDADTDNSLGNILTSRKNGEEGCYLDNNMTRDESTTNSEDRHLRMLRLKEIKEYRKLNKLTGSLNCKPSGYNTRTTQIKMLAISNEMDESDEGSLERKDPSEKKPFLGVQRLRVTARNTLTLDSQRFGYIDQVEKSRKQGPFENQAYERDDDSLNYESQQAIFNSQFARRQRSRTTTAVKSKAGAPFRQQKGAYQNVPLQHQQRLTLDHGRKQSLDSEEEYFGVRNYFPPRLNSGSYTQRVGASANLGSQLKDY
ncbi:hypothetical protein FGO68_gene1773 [Halteria grandinella]|uniref:EF-hand domain-containing protein n=1 Tax=Halteria grandinella TaxID=5974 RepID=A0A8J8T6N4_HALGN|nr:hypothetical protein FGO68_gene1773 [Halteria grandinella]